MIHLDMVSDDYIQHTIRSKGDLMGSMFSGLTFEAEEFRCLLERPIAIFVGQFVEAIPFWSGAGHKHVAVER